MPITTSEVHVDQALTNVSIAYAQEQKSFVASRIFNSINTSHLSNKYHVFNKDQWLRSEAGLRATGAPTRGANFTLSTGTFSCQQYGVHMDVDDYVAANADAGVDILTSATEYVTEKLLQKRDEVFAAAAFTTSTWTGSTSGSDITPSTKWSASGGTPIKDIADQQAAVHAKTGRTPNVLLIGKDVFAALRDSDDLLDRVKFTERLNIYHPITFFTVTVRGRSIIKSDRAYTKASIRSGDQLVVPGSKLHIWSSSSENRPQ